MTMEKILTAADELLGVVKEDLLAKNEKLEKGDTVVGVYNDCILTVGITEDGNTKIDTLIGKPYIFDKALFKGE